LLSEFHALTGIPLVINTSLNGSGEPIVETPEEAVRLFLNMRLDALVLEDYWIENRSWADWKEQEKVLMRSSLLTGGPLEVVARMSATGERTVTVKPLSAPEKEPIVVSEDVACILQRPNSGVDLSEVLIAAGISVPSARAAAIGRELVRLHKSGTVTLQRRQVGPRKLGQTPHAARPRRSRGLSRT
jgi:hypothetical protein